MITIMKNKAYDLETMGIAKVYDPSKEYTTLTESLRSLAKSIRSIVENTRSFV